MTCDTLVCANCASPVSEGRCRAQRRTRQEGPLAGLTPAALIPLLIALIAVAALAHEVAV